jgi:hypothetical protein
MLLTLLSTLWLVVASGCSKGSKSLSRVGGKPQLPGVSTGLIPWPVEVAHLRERLAILELPTTQGLALHLEPLLRIFVLGREIEVPNGIGIVSRGRLAPIHTHDSSGIIHIESPIHRTYTLGDIFAVWGVRLTRNCIGGYCSDGQNRLRIFISGQEFFASPETYRLQDFEVITVAFGGPDDLPVPVPTAYTFPGLSNQSLPKTET